MEPQPNPEAGGSDGRGGRSFTITVRWASERTGATEGGAGEEEWEDGEIGDVSSEEVSGRLVGYEWEAARWREDAALALRALLVLAACDAPVAPVCLCVCVYVCLCVCVCARLPGVPSVSRHFCMCPVSPNPPHAPYRRHHHQHQQTAPTTTLHILRHLPLFWELLVQDTKAEGESQSTRRAVSIAAPVLELVSGVARLWPDLFGATLVHESNGQLVELVSFLRSAPAGVCGCVTE
jgi:hypothetical protein